MEYNTKHKGDKLNNEKQKVSDTDSMNQGANNSVNMPNTIKYPKGGAIVQVVNTPTAPNQQSQQNQNQGGSGNSEESDKGKKKISGKFLVALICFVICYQYYAYVFILKPIFDLRSEIFIERVIILSVFHLLLFMMIWSFIVTMRTIPGYIPLYWGFYIGDEEYKRKRYCLICNAFKPERSHHCSVCNICVLNMDHHCPWVNNCIGFYNRKFFMQLLFYLFLLLWYITLSCLTDIYYMGKHIYETGFHIPEDKMIKYLVVFPAYTLICVLNVLNTMFFRYHLMLVLNNSTTIESLDPENKENTKVNFYFKFKLTFAENWAQVFGFDKLLWFFPVFAESGRPHGDGLNWKLNSAFEMNNMNNSQFGSQSGLPNNRTNQSVSNFRNNYSNI